MNRGKDFLDYLADIIDAIDKIHSFLSGVSAKDFEKDEKTQFAVIRALEIIGEAAKKNPRRCQRSIRRDSMARDFRDGRYLDSRLFWRWH